MLTTLISANRKTGVMATTYRSKNSCPKECKMYSACYAKYGVVNVQFNNATRKGMRNDAKQIKDFILSLPIKYKIRHFVTGDVIKNKRLDRPFIKAMIEGHSKRPDLMGFGFTHSWRRFKRNPFTQKSLTINASCDKVKEVAQAQKKGFDTVLIVPENTPRGYSNYLGEKILICPYQASNKLIEEGKRAITVQCTNCMLCAKKNRGYSIAFWPHGVGKKNFSF